MHPLSDKKPQTNLFPMLVKLISQSTHNFTSHAVTQSTSSIFELWSVLRFVDNRPSSLVTLIIVLSAVPVYFRKVGWSSTVKINVWLQTVQRSSNSAWMIIFLSDQKVLLVLWKCWVRIENHCNALRDGSAILIKKIFPCGKSFFSIESIYNLSNLTQT